MRLVRTTFALNATDLALNLLKSASRLRKTLHSSSFFLEGARPPLAMRSEDKSLGTGVGVVGDSE